MSRRSELELLLELTQAISAAPDVHDALANVLEKICRATGWLQGASWLLAKDARLERGPVWHVDADITDDHGLPARVVAKRQVVWEETRSGLAAVVGVPILAEEECIGALLFHVAGRTEQTEQAAVLVSIAAAHLGAWFKRKRAEDDVRVSEERFRLLVEHVSDAVFMLAQDGSIATWTPVAERMFGRSTDEAVGRPVSILYADGDPSSAPHVAAGREDRFESEGWLVRKDGTRFWGRAVTCTIRNAVGVVSGFATITRDLTLVRLAEDASRNRARELARSNRELEEFASIASHDLQEPLRKILGFSDRLERRCSSALDEKSAHYLERLKDAARRMQQLVDDLLAYSRVASRDLPVSKVDLAQIARDVIRDLESTIDAKHARIEIEALPEIEADATQMRQLLQNLVGNALKFCPRGETPLVKLSSRQVESGSARDIARWEIAVEDSGIGFDEKYLERMFGMLQRLHARSDYEGTGMGLAICRRIVEKHGGEITARSAEGHGATFVVTLPEKQEETRRVGAACTAS
jgi:two-component system, LuxR family, sensor kinase FixL